jgi:hypothetical protein
MPNTIERILTACDRNTLAGQRDFAILHLIIENSLKRQQIAAINISDFNYELRSLKVDQRYKRQGQSNPKEIISLSLDTATALQDWLNLTHLPSEQEDAQTPLFISLDRASYGHRLTGTAIYGIVKRAANHAEITTAIAPEHLRFSQDKYGLNSVLSKDDETFNKTNIKTNKTQARLTIAPKSVSNLECENQNRTHIDTSETQTSAIPYALTEINPDILNSLLADKRSLNTRRAYEKDLRYFFLAAYGQKPTEIVISQFLQLNRFDATAIVLRYK